MSSSSSPLEMNLTCNQTFKNQALGSPGVLDKTKGSEIASYPQRPLNLNIGTLRECQVEFRNEIQVPSGSIRMKSSGVIS